MFASGGQFDAKVYRLIVEQLETPEARFTDMV